jgi:hypothetical protein
MCAVILLQAKPSWTFKCPLCHMGKNRMISAAAKMQIAKTRRPAHAAADTRARLGVFVGSLMAPLHSAGILQTHDTVGAVIHRTAKINGTRPALFHVGTTEKSS